MIQKNPPTNYMNPTSPSSPVRKSRNKPPAQESNLSSETLLYPNLSLFKALIPSTMANPSLKTPSFLIAIITFLILTTTQVGALMPYIRSSLWDMMLPAEDPVRILEQTPVTIPERAETVALARADWKETSTAHVIALDIPGMKKDDIKIEVEENRVLRISGERKSEEEVEGEKWQRVERTTGKFWRQFRLPGNADLEHIKAHLEDGVLRITVPKLEEDQKRQPKVIDIVDQGSSAQDIRTTKAEM